MKSFNFVCASTRRSPDDADNERRDVLPVLQEHVTRTGGQRPLTLPALRSALYGSAARSSTVSVVRFDVHDRGGKAETLQLLRERFRVARSQKKGTP